jgi:hypothetical protein
VSLSVDTYSWAWARAAALRDERTCAECGKELAFDAPPRSPLSPSVETIEPFGPGDLRVVHRSCNERLGNGLVTELPGLRRAGRAVWW